MDRTAKSSVLLTTAFFLAASGIGVRVLAQDKAVMTDAQVEANVLRALASAPELSTQNIQSSSVYGTVTLSGNVHDETLRVKAENLVARAQGVKKVVDELALGDTPAEAPTQQADGANASSPAGQVLQSDGSYAQGAPGMPPLAQPDANYAGQASPTEGSGQPQQPGQPSAQNAYPPQNGGPQGNAQPPYGGEVGGQTGYPAAGPDAQRAYGAPPPSPQNGYGQTPQNGYGQGPQRGYGRYDYSTQGGQAAGIAVTVPSGAGLQVRLDRGIDSNHIQPGTPFTGTILSDVVAGGAVALPRGAQVQGTVVDAKSAGVLKGEGELALALTSVTLGGQTYPVNSAVWQREGRSKSLSTVNTALGLGALGAVFGGLAGGGAGAAIGAGVGGALGVGASAASPGGRVIVPPESVLTFSLAQPLALRTVSQSELQRLAYAAGPGSSQRPIVVRRRYYGGYGPYPPYGPYGYAY